MNKSPVKIVGFLAALVASLFAAYNGDYTTAVGVFSAALSSSNLKAQ